MRQDGIGTADPCENYPERAVGMTGVWSPRPPVNDGELLAQGQVFQDQLGGRSRKMARKAIKREGRAEFSGGTGVGFQRQPSRAVDSHYFCGPQQPAPLPE